jgi:three-Cys-motif partner protein
MCVKVEKGGSVATSARGQGLVVASDGLAALEVAEHAREKEFVINGIVNIFTTGMQGKWRWLYYIDPFAGPGVCRIKGSVAEIDGSPIVAAKSKAKFTDYFLADKDAGSLDVLRKRIDGLKLPETVRFKYCANDADLAMNEILSDLPPSKSSLGLALLDPWAWDFSFDSLAKLTSGRRLDLVINFPIGYIKRNWNREMPQLDQFMNGTNYKDPFQAAMQGALPGEKPARVLLDAYSDELGRIGYTYIKDNVVVDNSKHLALYCLLFASRNPRGAEFWDKVTQRKQSGQIRMRV